MWSKLNSVRSTQYGTPTLMTQACRYSQASSTGQPILQNIIQINKEYSQNLARSALEISPDFTDQMRNLAYDICGRVSIRYQKIYSAKTKQHKTLTECSYCYSAKTPQYPGPPYAYRNSLCFYYPKDTLFHRVLSHHLCGSSLYDTEQRVIFKQQSDQQRLEVIITFVATSLKNKLTHCPICWW